MIKAFDEVEWNFDKERVPEPEIVACCYWEYARESNFVRELRQRGSSYLNSQNQEDATADKETQKQLHQDLQKVQSIGYPSEVFLQGIFCPPDGVLPDVQPLKPGEVHALTGSFPRPWQELTGKEKAYRSQVGNDVERIPLVPFERGLSLDAKDLAAFVVSAQLQKQIDIESARRAKPNLSDIQLYEAGMLRFTQIRPSLYYDSGSERTVVSIQWTSFTDDEIATYFRKWVKANRPIDMPAPNDKGKKLNDWRVALNRLGIMRALHNFTFADNRFPKPFKERGEKQCYQARKLAFQKFRELFPCLPSGSKPRSWATRGSRPKS